MATTTRTHQRRSVRTALFLAALVGSASVAVPAAAVAAPLTTDSGTRTAPVTSPAALGDVTRTGHTWDRKGHTWDRKGHTWDRQGSSRAVAQDEPAP